jgi:ligand-binding SRPBCC domain-containing protein
MPVFTTQQYLPIGIQQAWDFFSSPKNLSLITPPELDFKILSQLDDTAIYEGMKISYTVKPILGIPVFWQTEITEVQHLKKFTDCQLKGPFKVWEHTHTFEVKVNGVLMSDSVNYEVPFSYLGKIIERLIIRNKIKAIFEFRKIVLEKLFIL